MTCQPSGKSGRSITLMRAEMPRIHTPPAGETAKPSTRPDGCFRDAGMGFHPSSSVYRHTPLSLVPTQRLPPGSSVIFLSPLVPVRDCKEQETFCPDAIAAAETKPILSPLVSHSRPLLSSSTESIATPSPSGLPKNRGLPSSGGVRHRPLSEAIHSVPSAAWDESFILAGAGGRNLMNFPLARRKKLPPSLCPQTVPLPSTPNQLGFVASYRTRQSLSFHSINDLPNQAAAQTPSSFFFK